MIEENKLNDVFSLTKNDTYEGDVNISFVLKDPRSKLIENKFGYIKLYIILDPEYDYEIEFDYIVSKSDPSNPMFYVQNKDGKDYSKVGLPIVGEIAVSFQKIGSKNVAFISDLFIKENERKKGYATNAINKLIDMFKTKRDYHLYNINRIELRVDKNKDNLVNFYKKLGFVEDKFIYMNYNI